MKQTGSVLDLAIEGQGMFALRDENNPGELIYTRDGAFAIDLDGEISTAEGYKVLSSNGNPITVPMRAAAAIDAGGVEELANLPLTGVACVKKVVTNLAVLDIKDGKFHLVERAPGVSVEEIIAATEGELVVPDNVPEMRI